MEVRQLNTLIRAAQFQSFSKAAESLGYSQSAVTVQIKALEEKRATAQARIMEAMGTAERGGYGSYSVTWKTQKRSTFDRKKWEKDHGEIPQDYFKSSESRTFRFKKDEQ